jgi:CubicO group peptidase (beta-lactamase class C family)
MSAHVSRSAAHVSVAGTCDDRFGALRATFECNFVERLEVGASVAVVFDGELVVDLWGGCVDDAGTPWQRDTVTNVWSTTKTMTALLVLLLADQGEVDLDAPVAHYWPEFAAAGKDDVLVRHLMAHTAGLPGWADPMGPADLYDWDKATTVLARQDPWWKPGTAMGYHAFTQGFLLGEVVRRVSGCSIGELFRTELAEPLGADFHIGAPPSVDARCARVIPPPSSLLEALTPGPGELSTRVLANPVVRAEQSWEAPWRRAELPACGGIGNARSIALVQQVVAGRGLANGVRYLSEGAIANIFRIQADEVDLVHRTKLRHGIGYALNSPDLAVSRNRNVCFWGGWGGSLVVCDLDRNMCFGYAMNRMADGLLGDTRRVSLLRATYQSLGG